MSASSRYYAQAAIQALCLAAGLALSATAVLPAHAQRAAQAEPGDGSTTTRLNIGAGKSVIVNLPRDAAEVFVGNPRIANAVVRSPRQVYVIAMAGGQTTIFAMENPAPRFRGLKFWSVATSVNSIAFSRLHCRAPKSFCAR